MKTIGLCVLVGVLLGCDPGQQEGGQPPVGVTRPHQDVDQVQQAVVTCVDQANSGVCNKYAWTQMPFGFQNCNGDNNTYDGELTVRTTINFVTYCMYAHPVESNHASLNVPNMQDWTNAPLHTFTFVSRLHGGGIVYSGGSYSGSFSTWLGPLNGGPAQTSRSLPWYIESMSINN